MLDLIKHLILNVKTIFGDCTSVYFNFEWLLAVGWGEGGKGGEFYKRQYVSRPV